MLAVWRQRPHDDDWVGFTSWRQFQKGFDFRFDEAALHRVRQGGVVCWGWKTLQETIHEHAERCHPGITGVLELMLREIHQQQLPDRYFTERRAPFCNYWAMPARLFADYMAWSWPIIAGMMDRWRFDPPFNLFPKDGTQDRSYAFFQERLFIVWWLITIGGG